MAEIIAKELSECRYKAMIDNWDFATYGGCFDNYVDLTTDIKRIAKEIKLGEKALGETVGLTRLEVVCLVAIMYRSKCNTIPGLAKHLREDKGAIWRAVQGLKDKGLMEMDDWDWYEQQIKECEEEVDCEDEADHEDEVKGENDVGCEDEEDEGEFEIECEDSKDEDGYGDEDDEDEFEIKGRVMDEERKMEVIEEFLRRRNEPKKRKYRVPVAKRYRVKLVLSKEGREIGVQAYEVMCEGIRKLWGRFDAAERICFFRVLDAIDQVVWCEKNAEKCREQVESQWEKVLAEKRKRYGEGTLLTFLKMKMDCQRSKGCEFCHECQEKDDCDVFEYFKDSVI